MLYNIKNKNKNTSRKKQINLVLNIIKIIIVTRKIICFSKKRFYFGLRKFS